MTKTTIVRKKIATLPQVQDMRNTLLGLVLTKMSKPTAMKFFRASETSAPNPLVREDENGNTVNVLSVESVLMRLSDQDKTEILEDIVRRLPSVSDVEVSSRVKTSPICKANFLAVWDSARKNLDTHFGKKVTSFEIAGWLGVEKVAIGQYASGSKIPSWFKEMWESKDSTASCVSALEVSDYLLSRRVDCITLPEVLNEDEESFDFDSFSSTEEEEAV